MPDSHMTISIQTKLQSGDVVVLGATEQQPCYYHGKSPQIRVGDRLESQYGSFFIQSIRWSSSFDSSPASREFVVKALTECSVVSSGDFCVERSGYTLAWVTLSDKGAAGLREDTAGPTIERLVDDTLSLSLVQGFVIPDERHEIQALLTNLALEQGYDLVLTTGGTGIGPRDVTPEATLGVIDCRLPALEQAMTQASLEKTPYAIISRAVAGTAGKAIIINFPGSPKAVAECLAPLLPALEHALNKLQGDSSDCALLGL